MIYIYLKTPRLSSHLIGSGSDIETILYAIEGRMYGSLEEPGADLWFLLYSGEAEPGDLLQRDGRKFLTVIYAPAK